MRRFIFLAFIAMAFAVPTAVGAGAPTGGGIDDFTVDRDATFIDGVHVRVTGTITCGDGDRFRVAVNRLTTNMGDTRGSSGFDNGRCTGESQEWRVTIERTRGPAFEPGTLGEARAGGQTGTPGDRVITDSEQETRRVDIN